MSFIGTNTQTIGTCSLCGGAVTLPIVWHGIVPPAATCSSCGAVAAQHGPVIPMRPARRRWQPTAAPDPYLVPTEWPEPLRWYTGTGTAPDGWDVQVGTPADWPLFGGWKPTHESGT